MSFECHLSVTVGRLSANYWKLLETIANYCKLFFPEPIVLSTALSKLLVLLYLSIYLSIDIPSFALIKQLRPSRSILCMSVRIGSKFRFRSGRFVSDLHAFGAYLGTILDPFGVRFGSLLPLSGRIECKFASDRPQFGPKSAHKQIKNIFPNDVRLS